MFCYLHFICGIIKAGLLKDPYTANIISKCKSLVAHLKMGHRMPLFTPSLKNAIEPRWSTVITMLKSIDAQWDYLHEVLAADLNKLSNIDIDYVRTLIAFLTPFEQATDQLQSTKQVTFFLVMMWNESLKDHLASKSQDCAHFEAIRKLSAAYHKENEHEFIHIWTKLALYVHPMTKGLQRLTDPEKDLVMSMV